VTLKIAAQSDRDNQFSRPIALQQTTGSSGIIGGSGSGFTSDLPESAQLSLAPSAIVIQTGDFKLEFPDDVKAVFPNGSTRGVIFLTPLKDARTPVDLPYGYYSKSIVQITPFNVKIDPGGKLTFPNVDGFAAGAPAQLFRYDSTLGKFVQDPAKAFVSADGQWIETEPGAIKITTYYFASAPREITTITGRVLERDGKTTVARAVVRFRGQEALTDGNGSYVLRYVPVRAGETISVDVSYLRSNARVERVESAAVPVVVGGITKVPDVLLPGNTDNRPPTILAPPKFEVEEGRNTDIRLVVTDPDLRQTIQVKVEGARFASIIKPVGSVPSAYLLRLSPTFSDSGEYKLLLTATDSENASARQEIALIVKNANRAPAVRDQSATVDEDAAVDITLQGVDPDNDSLTFMVVNAPANGSLKGEGAKLVYQPSPNFNGTDQFTFKASDASASSNTGTVHITVRPVNDPPMISLPGPQTVDEGKQIGFAVSASDPDDRQNLTFSLVDPLPPGVALTPASPTSSQFSWTPTFTQAGVYKITFKVTDDGSPQLSVMGEVQITVNDVTVLSVPGNQQVSEGQSLVFDVSLLSVIGNLTANITAEGLPEGAGLFDLIVGTRQFRWTPNFTQAGKYVVRFQAVSILPLGINETREVSITVLDVQRDLSQEPSPLSIFGAAGPLPQSSGDDGDALGASIATGDLNGDGVSDLAIGAIKANGNGLNSGQVYVFFAKRGMEGSIDLARQNADVTLVGEATEDSFGESLAIGDLNGDGKNDLVIGAPLANVGDIPDAGKVYGIFGALSPGAFEIAKVATLTILGERRSDRLGTSLALGPIHVKAGAAADLIVGAPGYDPVVTGPQLTDAGVVYVFYGGATLQKTIEASFNSNLIIAGAVAGAQFGATLAAGNFNGDEFADVAIGAPLSGKSRGAVYLALGSDKLALDAADKLPSLAGVDEEDNFGQTLAMGDLNGDGKADLIIGASGGDGPNNSRLDAGEVYVVYGGDLLPGRTFDLTIYGVNENDDEIPDSVGLSLSVGDFSGDGVPDLAIGAPGVDSGNLKRAPCGAIYLLFGAGKSLTGTLDISVKTADLTVFGADPGDFLGLGAIAIANIDGSETNDLILGIPQAASVNNSRQGAGEVRALWGSKR
jgi:hypothetical protein